MVIEINSDHIDLNLTSTSMDVGEVQIFLKCKFVILNEKISKTRK